MQSPTVPISIELPADGTVALRVGGQRYILTREAWSAIVAHPLRAGEAPPGGPREVAKDAR